MSNTQEFIDLYFTYIVPENEEEVQEMRLRILSVVTLKHPIRGLIEAGMIWQFISNGIITRTGRYMLRYSKNHWKITSRKLYEVF